MADELRQLARRARRAACRQSSPAYCGHGVVVVGVRRRSSCPARSSRAHLAAASASPGLSSTTVMTKNVATKWWRRSSGSARVYWPAEASSKVSRTGLRGSGLPQGDVRDERLAGDGVVAGAVERVELGGERLRADDVRAVARAVARRGGADLVPAEHGTLARAAIDAASVRGAGVRRRRGVAGRLARARRRSPRARARDDDGQLTGSPHAGSQPELFPRTPARASPRAWGRGWR